MTDQAKILIDRVLSDRIAALEHELDCVKADKKKLERANVGLIKACKDTRNFQDEIDRLAKDNNRLIGRIHMMARKIDNLEDTLRGTDLAEAALLDAIDHLRNRGQVGRTNVMLCLGKLYEKARLAALDEDAKKEEPNG